MSGVVLTVINLIYISIISLLFFHKEKYDTSENRIFKKLIILTLIGLLMEFIAFCVPNSNELHNIIILKIINIFIFLWLAVFALYSFVISRIDNTSDYRIKYKKQYSIYKVIICIVGLVLTWLPTYLYIGEKGVYSSGLSISFLYLLYFVFISYMVFMSLKTIKKRKITRHYPIIIFTVLMIILAVFQTQNQDLKLHNTVISIVIMIMYHVLENPDMNMIKQLKLANIQVEKSNRAKTEFLSSMSHEIRTPLNAIIGFSQCIKEEEDLNIIKEDANDIVVASQTLLEIVNGILDISKIEANKMEVINVEYDMISNINNIIKLIEPRITEKNIKFNSNIALDIPKFMYGDIGKIKQILTNLLTNAAKYTKEGEINFDISCINVQEKSSLIFKIKDTGRGIKEEQLSKLFTKFQRLEEDKNTTIEGTGLGLAITKSLVDILGGKIIVNSTYTEGSEFTVYLSQTIINKETNINVDGEDNLTATFFQDYNVLIVDDNFLNLKVATKLLNNYNIKTTTCSSGEECISFVKTCDYDLILLDDMMPDLSGKETLVKLKEDQNFKTPVIALTANAISGMKKIYLDFGFDDYLTKPIEKVELLNVLSRYYNNSHKENVINIIKKKVLIVDDDSTNVRMATRFLEKLDLEIENVTTGAECLNKIIQEEKYDLILMNEVMSGLSGIETLERLKEISNFNIPVIALTSKATSEDDECYLSKGFIKCVNKPIKIEKFLQIIKDILK